MIRRILAATLLFGVMFVSETWAAEGGEDAYTQMVIKLCAGIHNSFECARVIESSQVNAGASRHAVRKKESLVIRLNGKAAVLRDKGAAEEGAADGVELYSYIDYLSDMQLHVVHVQFYEGDTFLAIHQDSGQKSYPSGFPVVSPDLQRFVATSCDLVAGFDPNNIEIWRSNKGKLFLEWSQDIEGWGPRKAQWLASDRIRIEKECYDGNEDEHPCGTVELVREGGQWKFVQ
jgi:hypothetical protein